MSGRIPPEFIDRLLAHVDIVDVIDKRVPLKKAGAEFQALCPFHSEKTPSFTVSPRKQFYHCFGCGAHGTAIGFVMAYDRLSFPEAVDDLAREAGLEVPREAGRSKGPDFGPAYEALARAADFYRAQLRSHADAPRAVAYLKGRGLSGEIAREFGIGYAPPGWDNLIDHLGRNAVTLDRMRLAGLVSEGDSGKPYDKFRDRIMFPIRDPRGRVIAFGGRVLGDDKPKYLNSPETPLFHKGRELYGLYEMRQALRDIPSIVVVEGYMDVVALAQGGIRNAVATLGTATTPDHLERLFRLTAEVVFCFDGDRAGRDAAWKALNTALPLLDGSRTVRFLFLPEGEDPDSLVRKAGADAFRRELSRALPASEFLLRRLRENIDITQDIDGKARLAEAAKPLVERIPAGAFRDLMAQRLSQVTGVAPAASSGRPNTSRPGASSRRPSAALPPSAVRTAIRLLLEEPKLASLPDLPLGWENLDLPGLGLLKELLRVASASPDIRPAALVERYFGSPAWEQLQKLAAIPIHTPEEGYAEEFSGALRQLAQKVQEHELSHLVSKPLSDLTSEEKQRLKDLMANRRG